MSSFRIPSKVLAQLYDELDGDTSVVCTSRYEYKLFLDVFCIDDLYYDVVQRKSFSDQGDVRRRLVVFRSS